MITVYFGTFKDRKAQPEGSHAFRLWTEPGTKVYYLLDAVRLDGAAPHPIRLVGGFASALLPVMKPDVRYMAVLDDESQADGRVMLVLKEIRPT